MAGFQDLLRRNSGEPLPYHEHDGGDITGVIGSARIINATIDSLSIAKLTGGTYIDTDLTFASGSNLVSSNYSAGVSGWTIDGSGNAEFQDVTVVGVLTSQAGSAVDYRDLTNLAIVNADIVNLSADKINAGTLNAARIGAGDITADKMTIDGNLTVNGNLTMGAGGAVRSAASGERIELDNTSTLGAFQLYPPQSVTSPGRFYGYDGVAGVNYLELKAPVRTGRIGHISMTDPVWMTEALILTTNGSPIGRAGGDDPTSGTMYIQGSGAGIEFSANDSSRVLWISSSGHIEVADGGPTVPGYGFNGNGDLGMYRRSEDVMGFAANNYQRFEMGTGYFSGGAVPGSSLFNATGAALMRSEAGTAALPAFAFTLDTDTGMYRYAANKVGISTGGVVGLRIETAGIVTEAASYGTGTRNVFAFSWSSPNMYAQVDAAVEAVIGTVSDRRLKGDIKPLTDGLSRVLALSPVTYKPIAIGKTNGSGPRRAGLIADEVEKVEKWAVVGKATKDSYQSVSYQELTPLLIGAIKDLSTRVAVLEAV